MPTGYTAQLERMNWDLEKWLVEGIPRAFGCCVDLREHGDMSEKDLLAALKKAGEANYYKKKIEERVKEKSKLLKRTDEDWEKEYGDNYVLSTIEFNNKTIEQQKKRDKYNKVLERLKNFQKHLPRGQEEYANIVKFSIEQLEMVSSDFNPPNQSYYFFGMYDNWKDYKNKLIASIDKDLQYYKKEQLSDEKRGLERYNFYVFWSRLVKQCLPDVKS